MKLFKKLLLAGLLVSGGAQAELPDNSLYLLDSHWQDESAQHFMLPQLQGKRQVVAMIYTNCLHVCPALVADLQLMEKALPADWQDKVGFVLVSLTPEQDSAEVLRQFADKRGLDLSRWELLRGSAEDVRSLAMALDIKYKKIANGEMAHSNKFVVLDEQGRILFSETGLPEGPEAMVQRLIASH
ncbi:SCO family protein [Marinobacterium sp. CAU 1594]|nr:SCO family protein [Marinobacterium arenosum]